MKTIKSNIFITKVIVLAVIFTLTSCGELEREQSKVSKEISPLSQSSSETQFAASRARRLDGKPCIKKIDMEFWYMSGLRQYGSVTDFSTESLIHLMDHEISTVRFYSVMLLGERKEVSAIPKLEQAVNDESFPVRAAVTQSLLKMGNRKGIPVMEEFCEKASAEFDEGNYRNTVDWSHAAKVLAEAGEVSAIPYLKKLLTWDWNDSWGVRITALRSISKLYGKEPSVVTDISSMLNDKHPQIRAEAAEILQSLQSSP